MNQGNKVDRQIFISHDQATKVLQPRIGSFDNPTSFVSSQFASILMRGHFVIASRRNDRFNIPLKQQNSHGIAVVGAISNQAFRLTSFSIAMTHWHAIQGGFQQFYFRRGSLLHVYSERSTRAIGQYHELCSLASFSLPDQLTPFFAITNMPSMKHSFQRIFWRSFSWFKNVRQRLSNTPCLAHWHRRRWTVLLEPYLSGNSLQGAPVQRIQRMPSKHLRLSADGRPPLRERLGSGKCGSMAFHCLSVTLRQAMRLLLGLVEYSFCTSCQQVLG